MAIHPVESFTGNALRYGKMNNRLATADRRLTGRALRVSESMFDFTNRLPAIRPDVAAGDDPKGVAGPAAPLEVTNGVDSGRQPPPDRWRQTNADEATSQTPKAGPAATVSWSPQVVDMLQHGPFPAAESSSRTNRRTGSVDSDTVDRASADRPADSPTRPQDARIRAYTDASSNLTAVPDAQPVTTSPTASQPQRSLDVLG